jgi:hypothetical protein
MPVPVYNQQIVAQGVARLTGAFRNQPNCAAWTAVLLQPWQDLEDATWSVLTGRLLATAPRYDPPQTNPVFDSIGALVGQQRLGLSDTEYVVAIYLRIAVNRATGAVGDWAKFAKILLRSGATGGVQYYSATPGAVVPPPPIFVFHPLLGPAPPQGSNGAAFYWFVGGMGDLPEPAIVSQILGDAVPAGVYGCFGYSVWPDGNDFEFCDAENTTTTGQGALGDAVAGEVGGLLVSGIALT